MSNGDEVLDNWEEIDETGLCIKLETELRTSDSSPAMTSTLIASRPPDSIVIEPSNNGNKSSAPLNKIKLLQRPQSLQESNGPGGAGSMATVKPVTIAKKPPSNIDVTDTTTTLAPGPVMMVLHKSVSEYDAANYASPISNQTVKILRRPAQSDERRDGNDLRPKQPIKTLQQREQEYAQARLRIMGVAKNPEDDKPAASNNSTVATGNSSTNTVNAAQAFPAPASGNNNGSSNGLSGINHTTTMSGMHRSNSAPKMTQSAPCYNNYSNYFQTSALNAYFYQPMPMQQHQHHQPYNQRMPPQYVSGNPAGLLPPQACVQPQQQSWSPVVGGSVSAALLRQQQQPTMMHQHQQQPHPYNDNILRLPRGPCPNGSLGFQMRR